MDRFDHFVKVNHTLKCILRPCNYNPYRNHADHWTGKDYQVEMTWEGRAMPLLYYTRGLSLTGDPTTADVLRYLADLAVRAYHFGDVQTWAKCVGEEAKYCHVLFENAVRVLEGMKAVFLAKACELLFDTLTWPTADPKAIRSPGAVPETVVKPVAKEEPAAPEEKKRRKYTRKTAAVAIPPAVAMTTQPTPPAVYETPKPAAPPKPAEFPDLF